MDPLPKQIGRYTITDTLGRGGMGVVLLGRDPELDREVAIKLLDSRSFVGFEARARFTREARALARLSEPHIVQVFDFLSEGPTPALVMERLRGRTLRDIISQQGAQPLQRVLDCAWQVLRGLSAAHAAGIVHRDIKPSNLMLVDGGLYKILDFGLAEVADESDLTGVGGVVGTIRYLAPERRRGIEAGPTGDLWSLGATLIEMASGKVLPLDGSVSAHLVGASPAVNAWLARMMATDHHSRFATASQALQALATAMPAPEGQPSILPRDPSSHDSTSVIHSAQSGHITRTVRPVVSSMSKTTGGRSRVIRIPFVFKLITTIWLISTAATLIAGWAISSHAIDTQEHRLRDNLSGIAGSAAMLMDPELQRRLIAHPDPADSGLAHQRAVLRKFRALHKEILYIYTLAPLPETPTTGVVQFICDASEEVDANHNGVIDPDEILAQPGQRYPGKAWPELLRGFDESCTDSVPRVDQWGTFISGYAPIRAADGTSLGLIAVDVPAAHIQGLRESFITHSVVLLVSTLIAFLAAGVLVALRLRRPVAELQRGMQAVANGDLDVTINVHSRDEFQVLAESFAAMRDELRRAAVVRQAFESFVMRSLDGSSSAPLDQGGAQLYVHLTALDGRQDTALERLAAAMPRLFQHAQAHGGLPERVIGGGIAMGFATTDAADLPQERAVRAALAMLADLEYGGGGLNLAIGIATGVDAITQAQRLSRSGATAGLDLILHVQDFAPIRPAFYADRCQLLGIGEVYAIKGAVSG